MGSASTLLCRFPWLAVFFINILFLLCVNILYLCTLDYSIIGSWIEWQGLTWLSIAYLGWMYVGLPVILGLALWNQRFRIASPRQFCILIGVVAGLWANALLVAVPYLGVLPSSLSTMLVHFVGGGEWSVRLRLLAVYGTNLLIFSIMGVCGSIWVGQRNPTHMCKECAYDLTGNVSGVCPECGTWIESV